MNNNQYLQESIIESINNIDVVTLEAEYNVLNAILDDYHKSMLIYENYQGDDILEFSIFQESYIQEGLGDVVKKGIVKGKAIVIKIWNAIKALLRFIGKQIQRVINFVKNLFRRNKHPKSADQILDELNVKPKNRVFIESAHNKTPRSYNVSIPSNSLSQMSLPDIKVISKDIIIKFNKDKSLMVTPIMLQEHLISKNRERLGITYDERVKSQNLSSPDNTAYCIKLLNDQNMFNEFLRLVRDMDEICQMNKTNLNEFNNDVDNLMKGFYKINNTDVSDFKPITIDNLMKMHSQIAKVMIYTQSFKDPSFDINQVIDDKTISSMNSIVVKLESIQYGLNNICGALQNSSLVDATFIDSIKDINELGLFVSELIKAGIPSKYIAYNVWLVSDKSIRGDDEKYKPIWGQSRAVLFPSNDRNSIYKIAINSVGISGNQNEYRITNIFKTNKSHCPIVPVLKSYTNYHIIKMKKVIVDENHKCGIDTLAKIKSDLQNFLSNNKYNINISMDIHERNVGIDPETNDWVVMDYGYIIQNMNSMILPNISDDYFSDDLSPSEAAMIAANSL